MMLSELIKTLEHIQAIEGDIPVLSSADEEMNAIGDVFEVTVGKVEGTDYCNSKLAKVGDKTVLIVPTI